MYGGSFGLLNMTINGNQYSGSSITFLAGLGFVINDQVSVKLLVSPFSTGDVTSTAAQTSTVKVSNIFSTLVGVSYYFNK